MGKRSSKGTSNTPDDAAEPPDYVERWARDLISAGGKRDARRVLADYEAIASDPKVTKHSREVAELRAKTLMRLL